VGIGEWLEGLMQSQGSLALVLVVSLALGLKHASDPDHLAAVTTLIAGGVEGEPKKGKEGIGRAGTMGLLWGLGHGTTLILIGLPLVLVGKFLPEPVVIFAEVTIGAIIVLLAVRLLVRWRRGAYHAHTHRHEAASHRHLHSHAEAPAHQHGHAVPHRTPLSSYGVGLVHGVGGSGGLTLLLLSTIPDKGAAAVALLIFALGTAISMSLLSTAFGFAIAGGPVARRFEQVAPVLGVAGMAFGVWYALGAVGMLGYPF
jgi:cytochrome c biogenesis protein CcdA